MLKLKNQSKDISRKKILEQDRSLFQNQRSIFCKLFIWLLQRERYCESRLLPVRPRVISRRRSGTSSSHILLSSQYPLPVPFHLGERRFGQSNRGEESLALCTCC